MDLTDNHPKTAFAYMEKAILAGGLVLSIAGIFRGVPTL
jgi:hypothetical protein